MRSSISKEGLMDPISGIGSTLPTALTRATAKTAGPSGFGEVFSKALEQVSEQQKQSSNLQQRFQLSDPEVSLEQTMVASQTASISFQALIQVRNRFVAAYQDIMNMSV
jgi:flagellar hook-basal body complex protein FliE